MILAHDNPILRQLALAQEMVAMVARREFTCCGMSGGPGIGKTWGTRQTLEKLNAPYRIVRGTHAALMLAAYELRKGGVIILDDADNLVTGGGAGGANLMKQLLAPEKVRVIHNHTMQAIKNQGAKNPKSFIPPPSFETSVGVVWLTNINLEAEHIPDAMRDHIQPLVDRGMQPVRVSDNPAHLLEYVLYLVVEKNLLLGGGRRLGIAEKQEVVDYFYYNAWRLPTISVRAIEELGKLRAHSPENWREHMDAKLLKKPISELPLPGSRPIVAAPVGLKLVQ